MNLARYFSYTRFLERELVRERLKHEREKAAWIIERQELSNEAVHERVDAQCRHDEEKREWDDERRQLINSVMLKNGAHAPFVTPAPSTTNGKKRTRAIGPYQINAREALREQEIEAAKDEAARAPELPPIVEEAAALTEEQKSRIRAEAEARGLLGKEHVVSEPATV